MFKESKELYHPSQTPEVSLERKDNVVRIDKPEGTYTIIYGDHSTPQDPEQLPENLEGLVLETGTARWPENLLGYLYYCKNDRQLASLFSRLEEKKIPVIFSDARLRAQLTIPVAENLMAIAEAGLGSNLLTKAKKELKTKQISRRKFLRVTGAVALASYLSTPLLASLSRAASIFTNVGHGPTAEFQKISHKLHPEADLFVLTLRNAILAQKEQWLMEKMGNRPHFATVLGGDHCGIEDQIQYSPQRRLKFLKALKPLLPRVISPKETFYKIAIFDFNGRVWQVRETLEEPELRKLITS